MLLCALCIIPCYNKGKNGKKIITQKLYVNEDPEGQSGNTNVAYTTRESGKCCCIVIIDIALRQFKIVAIVVALLLVAGLVVGALPEGGAAVILILIVGIVVVAGGVGAVYGLYLFVMNQKRYRQLQQELYGPTEKDGPVAEVNWVKCDAKVLGYSATSEKCKQPGHPGVAHKGVLMAMPIINDDTRSWPPPDEKFQVHNARYFFRSVNGLKVAYNEESPDAVSSWESNRGNDAAAVESVGKNIESEP
jgi:hypothetical protein